MDMLQLAPPIHSRLRAMGCLHRYCLLYTRQETRNEVGTHEELSASDNWASEGRVSTRVELPVATSGEVR